MSERRFRWVSLLVWLVFASARGQSAEESLEGMWSDPPVEPIDFICASACTQPAIDRLTALLDDPANDDRSFEDLRREAGQAEAAYLNPRIKPETLAARIDPTEDPGYVNCEPWGFARQILARHQLEIRHYPDRIEMNYGEWDAHRTIYLDADSLPADRPPSLYGYSVGRYEGDTLVIETSGISANLYRNGLPHGDQLRVIERYSRDGDRLWLTATFEDPSSLLQPVEVRKVWGWAPELGIAPYVDCELPTESAE